MKKLIVLMVAIGIIAMSGVAIAADTNTLTVQASVVGTCKFSSATSTLNFGNLDPSSGANVNGTTTTQFWCTKGISTDVIAANNGQNFAGGKRGMKDTSGADVIPYTLTLTKDANPNNGPTAPRTLTIDGQVLGTDYTSKTASSYADSVTLNITP
jgi:spore coat protein U-like protein